MRNCSAPDLLDVALQLLKNEKSPWYGDVEKLKSWEESRAYEKFAPASTDLAFFKPSTSLVRASLRAP